MQSLAERAQAAYGKGLAHCDYREVYHLLLALVKERVVKQPSIQGNRKLYYVSAEFLLGKLLASNLFNLGLYQQVDQELAEAGLSLSQVEAVEPEPSLGNGGLGRLAACFLDSIATLGLPGDGIGLNYHLGLFRQAFRGEKQVELPNPWLQKDGWLHRCEGAFRVPFGRLTLQAVQYDLDVVGNGGGVNKLHLFDMDTLDEGIVGEGIAFDKTDILHNLTLFLYPDDCDAAGQLLRVYQQYFLVSCAAQMILRDLEQSGKPLNALAKHVVIQINDTHPSMIIPELVRLLVEKGLSMDEAIWQVSHTCAYTNHTILAEALEKWPISFIQEVAPQLVPILRELDCRAKAQHHDPRVAIIDADERVHMAHMDIHYGFSVNGVAALHTEILKTAELKPFYDIYPDRFQNKTNGITFRRWLHQANPELSAWISGRIGQDWHQNPTGLEKLLAYQEDDAALSQLLSIKQHSKQRLAAHLLETQGVELDTHALFDIQIKRIHEYKRQQMNALYAIYQYQRIKGGHLPSRPITMIFGGKAAAAYVMAKDVIHLILCLSKLIDQDEAVRPWLRVVMVENYNVTHGEKLFPACDLSEQISLASKEASGTGNMKFMLNGAVTIGTMDGANVEMYERVGPENIFIFGKSSQEVIRLYETGGYQPSAFYRGDRDIENAVDFILSDALCAVGDKDSLFRLYKDMVSRDWFMALLDLRDYITMKNHALAQYEDRKAWARKMLVNIAQAGYFSSDRTIQQYNQDIWKLEPSGEGGKAWQQG